MKLPKFPDWLSRRSTDDQPPVPEVLQSQRVFRHLLNVERSRSERSGSSIALVAFSKNECVSPAASERFVRTLCNRLRVTDHTGMMPGGLVGVLLWNADRQGAMQFIELLGKAISPEALPPYEVYEHPFAGVMDADGTDSRDGQEDDTAGDSSEETLADSAELPLDLLDDISHEQEHEQEQEAIEPLRSTSRILPLEALFARPLPWWKRAIDIAGATFGLVALSPLLAATAVAVRVTSPGPVFFSQWRSGLGGRRFRMYKFRSMVVDAEAQKRALLQLNEQDGPAFKLEHDPRITPVGHLIRRSSIDELPQLWNVLRGDMSLVGPRPLPCTESDACQPWQKRRLQVTPGLTCIWQVQDRRTKIPFADWARMDIRYIGNRTLKHDLRLVWQTVATVLGRKGV